MTSALTVVSQRAIVKGSFWENKIKEPQKILAIFPTKINIFARSWISNCFKLSHVVDPHAYHWSIVRATLQ